ncbi:MAG: Lrp/AsnC family transcriptional regulator, partial [Rhabdochlamydiaceae bacterium]
ASKRVRVASTYIGRIKEDGIFVRKEETANDELQNARAVIQAHGGRVVMPEEQRHIPEELGIISDTDKRLLTALSMNARASRKFIGGIAGLSASATHYRIKHLEERFGIKYIPEIDTMKLGFLTYLVFVKFYNEKPTLEEIKSSMENELRVQFVGVTSGAYDLIVLILAENNHEAAGQVYTVRTGDVLGKYEARWEITPFETSYGVLPLRENFFDLLKDKVWIRSKMTPKLSEGNLTNREYSLLKELNNNGMVEFTGVDSKYKLDRGAAQYAYYRLKERGLIKRITITMNKLPLRYNAAVLLELINGIGFLKTRDMLLSNIISRGVNDLTNKYSLVGDIGVPNGVMLILPVIEQDALQKTENELRETIEGSKIDSLIITTVVLGKLCYRNYDNDYSTQYEGLVKRKIVEQEKKIVYEEKKLAKQEA